MFLSIYHNQSGEEYVRRMAPNENLSVEDYARRWVEESFDGEIRIVDADGYIPTGCAEYYAEIRDTKAATGSCWESFDFYTELTDPDE